MGIGWLENFVWTSSKRSRPITDITVRRYRKPMRKILVKGKSSFVTLVGDNGLEVYFFLNRSGVFNLIFYSFQLRAFLRDYVNGCSGQLKACRMRKWVYDRTQPAMGE